MDPKENKRLIKATGPNNLQDDSQKKLDLWYESINIYNKCITINWLTEWVG
jgi:hypothetical protein